MYLFTMYYFLLFFFFVLFGWHGDEDDTSIEILQRVWLYTETENKPEWMKFHKYPHTNWKAFFFFGLKVHR